MQKIGDTLLTATPNISKRTHKEGNLTMSDHEQTSTAMLSIHEEHFHFSEEERAEAQRLSLQILEDEELLD